METQYILVVNFIYTNKSTLGGGEGVKPTIFCWRADPLRHIPSERGRGRPRLRHGLPPPRIPALLPRGLRCRRVAVTSSAVFALKGHTFIFLILEI